MSPRYTRTMEEMRELAIQRATDRVRDVVSVLERALHQGWSSTGESGAALAMIANASHAQALSEVLAEHVIVDPRFARMLEASGLGGIGVTGGLVGIDGGLRESNGVDASTHAARTSSSCEPGRVRPHPFLPRPRKPEATSTCAVCGQEEDSLIHHPELVGATPESA